ncbi:MAG: carbamoyltransferase [Proteobacteria bacterium]|nr:carbamoyltransferase [Pseudomonadota bacterium]
MLIAGISAYYHDSAAALLQDGKIVAAAEEERFSRRKHDSGFPHHALRYCLGEARVNLSDVDRVVFYDKPFLKFERILETAVAFAPRGFQVFARSMPAWLQDKLFLKRVLARELRRLDGTFDADERMLFSEHHLSHAASAYFPSPFESAAVLTIDGVGEWATTSLALGNGNSLAVTKEIHFPHSLGLMYSAFTQYCGFEVNSGEYKLMGLAPYGEPRFAADILEHIIDLKDDGSFRLNLDYFGYCTGARMINRRFQALMGGPARQPETPIDQKYMDVAASIQAVTEEAILRMTRAIARDTGAENLCLAGGVALNCVANGKILRDGKFKRVWIQPASGDSGGALGAALAAHYLHFGLPRTPGAGDSMRGALLGPGFGQDEIEARLGSLGAKFEVLDQPALIDACAQDLASGKTVAWFQGRMEFGPRSLGARSILADPRSPGVRESLNAKVKRRESFRPFAPAVLLERACEWFDLEVESPYMLLVAGVSAAHCNPASEIPAVTHVDRSARIQTVGQNAEPGFRALLERFEALTGCPVLVNTSFNVRDEPIVCTPEDAYNCFLGTDIDVLAIGRCRLEKAHAQASQ